MLRSIARSIVAPAVVVTLALGGRIAPAAAQDVDAIFAKYNAAIDPQNRAARVAGLKSVGGFEVPAAGISATMTVYQRRPNQMATVIQMQGVGEIRQGFDGTTTWSMDPMAGPRILTGKQAASISDGTDFAMLRRERANYASAELAGEGDVDGDKCLKVKLTYKSGQEQTECFSSTSGLLLEVAGTQATPQGDLTITTRYSDYRDVGGILMAHKLVASTMGMQQVITFTERSAGEQDATHFDLPPAIKALKGP